MQTNEQGDVILNIGANVNKAKNALNDLGRAVNGVFKSFKGQTVSSPQLDKLNAQAEQSKAKIEALQAKIREMNSAFSETPTAPMQRLIDKEKELEAAAQRVKAQITSTTPQPLVDKYTTQYNAIIKQLDGVVSRQIKLNESGKAFNTVAQEQPKAFEKANDQLRQEQQNLSVIQSKIASINEGGAKSANSVGEKFKNMGNSVVNAFRKIRNHAKDSSKSAASSFNGITDAVKKGAKTFLKYVVGVRSFFILFRKLRTAVVDGYKELAKFSDEVNDSMSSATSALTKLKNSTAAALQPLITAFTPFITSFSNKLSAGMERIGQFFAALTGQNYVYKATDVQNDYAASLEDTADSADKAKKSLEKYLSPLDDINRYSEDSTSADTATASSAKFAKGTVEDSFSRLADKIKGYFTDIFKPIKTAWNKYGKPVMLEWEKLVGNIKGLFSDVARAFRNVWTNGTGERVSGNILKLWQSVLGVVNSLVGTFRDAWNKDALGESVIQSFIDKFNNLLLFIRDVADTFKEVWDDGTGERIWTNILTIVRNINGIIGGFWAILKKAWDKNDAGKKIWQGILGIVDDIVEFFRELSDLTFEWVEDLDLSPIMEGVGLLVDGFRDLAKVLMEKFKDAYKNVLLPFGKWTIEKAVPALLKLFSSALKVLADIIDKVPIEALGAIAANIASLFVVLKGIKIINNVVNYFKSLGKAFTTLGATISAHPYAAALLAIAAAIGTVVTAVTVANRTKWETSDLKKSVDEINGYFEDVAQSAQNMKDTIEDVNKSHIEIQADVSQVETLKDRLMEVIKDGIISEEEMPEYETIINLLNKVDGFEDMWNGINLETIDGEIHINADEATEALDRFLEQWKVTQWQTALSTDYSDIYSSLRINKRDVTRAQNLADEAKQNLLDKIKETGIGSDYMQLGGHVFKEDWTLEDLDRWYEAYKAGKFQFPLMDSGIKDVAESYDDAITSLSEYQTNFDELTRSMEGNWEAQKFLNGETNNFVGALYAVDSGLISEADALDLLKDTGITSYKALQDSALLQQRAERAKNEDIKAGNEEVADSNEMKNISMLGSDTHAYAEMKKVSGEWHTAVNNNQQATADNAEKAAIKTRNSFVTAFSGIGDKAAELWESLKSMFSGDDGIGKGIANFAITGINKIVQAVNSAITVITDLINSGFNGLRDFEIVGAKPFGWLPTLTAPQIPEIPALARGAVLPAGKPFLAMLGDQKNGRNLEAPEDTIRQIVREETRTQSPNYTIPVQWNGRTLFTLMIEEGRAYLSQTGTDPFNLKGAY